MITLRKLYLKLPPWCTKDILTRSISSGPTLIAEPLIERSLLKVHGNEVSSYLQGLITNDMGHLKRGSNSLFAMFLNNAGRVLYDTIVYRTGDENVILLECDKSVCGELKKHLKLYRVRRKIEIESLGSQYQPWVVFSAQKLQNKKQKGMEDAVEAEITMTTSTASFDTHEIVACQDPRVKALGVRLILPRSISHPEISELFTNNAITKPTENQNYKYLRYSLGVGEGVEEHIPNKSFPLEVNCDFLHGVSFHKGCYIGQELTARVHHQGVIRKRLMPLKLTKKIEKGVTNVQTLGGMVVGTLRGFTGDVALALVRVEQALKFPDLVIDGDPCELIVPEWWPKESPNKFTLKEKQVENT